MDGPVSNKPFFMDDRYIAAALVATTVTRTGTLNMLVAGVTYLNEGTYRIRWRFTVLVAGASNLKMAAKVTDIANNVLWVAYAAPTDAVAVDQNASGAAEYGEWEVEFYITLKADDKTITFAYTFDMTTGSNVVATSHVGLELVSSTLTAANPGAWA